MGLAIHDSPNSLSVNSKQPQGLSPRHLPRSVPSVRSDRFPTSRQPSPQKKQGGVPTVALRQYSRPHAAQFHTFHTFHPRHPAARTPNFKNREEAPSLFRSEFRLQAVPPARHPLKKWRGGAPTRARLLTHVPPRPGQKSPTPHPDPTFPPPLPKKQGGVPLAPLCVRNPCLPPVRTFANGEWCSVPSIGFAMWLRSFCFVRSSRRSWPWATRCWNGTRR